MKVLTEANRKFWVLTGVSMASFLGCIDFTIVNTALPAIQLAFHATVTQLQWIITIFVLALSTCMVIMGRLADIYGRRLLLYIGMIIFGLASLGAGLSVTIYWLILFRLIQGASCAVLYIATGAIVASAFPEQERGKAMGILFGVNGIGLAIGPVLGGIIVSALSWRWVFLVNVPIIIISLIICFASVSESKNREHGTEIDWLGLVLFMVGLACLILGVTQGSVWGWNSAIILSLFAIAALALILFYKVEMKTSSPIIQFHLFINRMFITSIVATFALAFFYCVAFFLMPLYLHNIRGESGYVIGFMLLPTMATVAILSPLVGRLVDQFGPKILLVSGLGFFVLSAWLQTRFKVDSSLIYILFAFILMGIGWACILGPSTVAALSSLPENMGAVAMGSSWTLHNVGGAIGLALGTVIYHIYARSALLADLVQRQVVGDGWVDKVVGNPDNAIVLLQQHTHLYGNNLLFVFQHFFLAGYQAAMWLLVASSFVACLAVFLGMKGRA